MDTKAVLLVEDSDVWSDILSNKVQLAFREVPCAARLRVKSSMRDAWEALNSDGPWSLLITDVSLGGRNEGLQLIEHAHQLGIPCIAVSGAPEVTKQDVVEILTTRRGRYFVDKPHFQGDTFVGQVRDILREAMLGPTAHDGANQRSPLTTCEDPRQVFVVHGRDDMARRAMFDFLRSLELRPLEWDDAIECTGSGAPYVGEVLDAAFEKAQVVLVVMTGDDEAMLRQGLRKRSDPTHEVELTPQARPNVIFEAGMALARDPRRTILVELAHAELRPFSDIGGRHVLRFKGSARDRQSLADRLLTAGCPVRREGQDWLSSGDFRGALCGAGTQADDATRPSGVEDWRGGP